MAVHAHEMRVNLVYAAAASAPDPAVVEQLTAIGPAWGSWKTWSSCKTDNVICHDLAKARELTHRAIQAVCNFYLPEKFFQTLNRPPGINFYQGDFSQEVRDLEDVIALHLVADRSDLVLMFGYDLSTPIKSSDRMENHRMTNRMGLLRQVFVSYPDVQWVHVTASPNLDTAFESIPNLTCDSLNSVLQLLG